MSCNTSSLHITGIPVENQESRSVKLKNLYDIFYSVSLYYFTNFVTFTLPTYQPIEFEKISTLFLVSNEKRNIKYEYRKKLWFLSETCVMETGAYISATTWYIRSKLFGIDSRIQIKIKSAAGNAKKYAKY
jgi:hypothetical protein